MGRQSDQKLGHQAERERNHQEHAETGEDLQRLWWIAFARIGSVKIASRRIFISVHS
jgi:hypothetical protein